MDEENEKENKKPQLFLLFKSFGYLVSITCSVLVAPHPLPRTTNSNLESRDGLLRMVMLLFFLGCGSITSSRLLRPQGRAWFLTDPRHHLLFSSTFFYVLFWRPFFKHRKCPRPARCTKSLIRSGFLVDQIRVLSLPRNIGSHRRKKRGKLTTTSVAKHVLRPSKQPRAKR